MNLTQGLNQFIEKFTKRVDIYDLVSSRNHSRDFNASRSEYISLRIRLVSFIFFLLSLLWIPVDYWSMGHDVFVEILVLRLGFAAAFLGLGLWGGYCNSLFATRVKLLVFSLIPGIFYLGSQWVLNESVSSKLLLDSYSFLPYLMISLLAIAPLTLKEGMTFSVTVIGFYLFTETLLGRLLTLDTATHLWLMILLAGLATWVQLSQLHMLLMLYREATRDFLTGLVNRRVLLTWLDSEIERAQDEEQPLSMLLFDLDLFKRINDNYGHLTGDQVLKAFADLLDREVGENGYVGRYGGEEFLAILSDCDGEQARRVAESIRIGCENIPMQPLGGGDPFHFTTSIGVGTLRPGEGGDLLISRVDVALYAAKRSGRNLVTESE